MNSLRNTFFISLLLIIALSNLYSQKNWNGAKSSRSGSTPTNSPYESAEEYSFRDSSAIDTTKQAKYVKRDYNHKEQVIVGSSIMAFIAVMLVAMNNYNPKR